MRLMHMFVGTALVLALGGTIRAEAVPYQARVKVDDAEVRSGAGSNAQLLYATNRLRRGDVVDVVKVGEDGWLGIKPPAGSFSWVNARLLERVNKTQSWLVSSTVPVLIGSSLRNEKPTVKSVDLERGAQVVAVGEPLTDRDGIWLPIQPPPQEVRYIRADAVEKSNVPTTGSATPANWATAPPGNPAAGVDPRLQQAQQAEATGNWAEAERLYNELGRELANTNHELAMQYVNRASFLHERYRGGSAAGAPNYGNPAATSRLQPVPASYNRQGGAPPAQICGTVAQYPNQAAAVTQTRSGFLRLSQRCVNYQRTYVLDDSQGVPIAYVSAQPGVNLEPFVGSAVEIQGPLVYRMEERLYYMTAAHVTPLR